MMATVTTAPHPASPLSAPATSERGLLGEVSDFFREFIVAAFDPYRPELYYMRGPGPASAAKTKASS